MLKHKKIYLKFFNYSQGDYIPCEVCTSPAVDIHHISPRGMGGSKTKDVIENLAGLCRKCHDKTRAASFNEEVKKIHLENVNRILHKRSDKIQQDSGEKA